MRSTRLDAQAVRPFAQAIDRWPSGVESAFRGTISSARFTPAYMPAVWRVVSQTGGLSNSSTVKQNREVSRCPLLLLCCNVN